MQKIYKVIFQPNAAKIDPFSRQIRIMRLLSCLPIDSVTGSIYTSGDTPAVIEMDHQETEGETEQLVQVDGMSELQPLRIFLTKW